MRRFMKKNISLFSCLLFILIAFSHSIAQERKITEQEMNAVGKNWVFKGKAYRSKKSGRSIDKKNGKTANIFNETSEYDVLGNSHTVMEIGKSVENLQRSEYFIIGKTSYDLHPTGKWRVGEVKPESEEKKARRIAQYSETEKIAEHFYKGKILLNNLEVDLYESNYIEKSKRNGKELVTVITSKRWYNSEGMPLKIETTTDNELSNAFSVFEFELDPAIKIEAPIK